MIKRNRFFFFAALAAAVGCGGTEIAGSSSSGSGGAGGAGSTTSSTAAVTSSSSSSASTSTSTSTSTSSTSTSVSSSSSSASSSGSGGGNPACGSNPGAFAVDKLWFGDRDFKDVQDANAWKGFGFNIDGKVSTAASVDVCKPRMGASPSQVYPDGNNGIDNNFGKSILPVLLALSNTFPDQANSGITGGSYTLLFNLENLGAGTDQSPIVAKLYSATALGAPPVFDGTDCWPAAPEGLNNPADFESSKVSFDMSTLVANHFTSVGDATLTLTISFFGLSFSLPIHHARFTVDLAPDHKSATGGQIGGVLDTAEFIATVKQLAGNLDPSLCSGPTIDSLLTQFEQASDILSDGTQDPAQTCDGISIGLGFTLKPVSVGAIGPAAPPPNNPCP